MDTEQNYENRIRKVKTFINELEFVQNEYFQGLCDALGMTDEGKDWLFDHVFNSVGYMTFQEYLESCGKTFGELK